MHGEDPHSKGPPDAARPTHDLWHDTRPGVELLPDLWYSTNFYTSQAIRRIEERNTSRPFWLHLCFQAVHAGLQPDPPAWERIPAESAFRSQSYGSMLAVADSGIRNITEALKAHGLWDSTLLVLTADNGGDCDKSGSNCEHSGNCEMASNYPLLGRKCTPWEGGTRTAALVSGGLIPAKLRGTESNSLIHVSDWYPTLTKLAGVDPTDDWVDSTGVTRPIDGVDVWTALTAGGGGTAAATGRQWLPTTDTSIIFDAGVGAARRMYKLYTSAHKADRFLPNGTTVPDTHNPCLPNAGAVRAPTDFPAEESVPTGCTVCSPSSPCLFEVLLDPSETDNLAKDPQNKALVASMVNKLAGYSVYIPPLTPANLACYNCSFSYERQWGGFSGPCCLAK